MSVDLLKTMKPIPELGAAISSEPLDFDFETDEFPMDASTPLQDLCVIAPLKLKEKTKGGLYLPSSQQERIDFIAQFGRIVKEGEFFYKLPPYDKATVRPKVGDFVQFLPYEGRRFDVEKKTFWLLASRHILQVLNPVYDIKLYT